MRTHQRLSGPLWLVLAACLLAALYGLARDHWQLSVGALVLAFVVALSPRIRKLAIKTPPISVEADVVPPEEANGEQPSSPRSGPDPD
jgi:hypothetical protein